MLKKIFFLTLCVGLLHARVVLDSDGREVQVPDIIEHATPIIGGFVQMSAMLGNEDKIISGSPRIPAMMMKIFPKIRTSGNQSGMLGNFTKNSIIIK